MSMRLDTYSLLVDKFGEETAYRICEELGGTTIEVPTKQHRKSSMKRVIKRVLPVINSADKARTVTVKTLSVIYELSECSVYRIIREVEDGK